MSLVWGFVETKAEVPVGAEDSRFAEIRREQLRELFHGAQDRVLIESLVAGPVRLRVVGLKALVEFECFRGPPAECHRSSLASTCHGHRGGVARRGWNFRERTCD